jgi:hypothetical protein
MNLPEECFLRIGQEFPGIWRMYYQLEAKNGPPYFSHNINPWLIKEKWLFPPKNKEEEYSFSNFMFCTNALGAWGVAKNEIHIDESILTSLYPYTLKSEETYPDLLYRIPYYCVYVDWRTGFDVIVKDQPNKALGFFAHTFIGKDSSCTIIIIGVHKGPLVNQGAKIYEFILVPWGGIVNGVPKLFHQNKKEIVGRAISCLLFINQQFDEHHPSLIHYVKTIPKIIKNKNGLMLMPSKKKITFTVGNELGQTIRNAQERFMQQVGTHASPCPHIRRAHWHTYLTGPKKNVPIENRKRKLMWIPPLPIAMPRKTQEEV